MNNNVIKFIPQIMILPQLEEDTFVHRRAEAVNED